MRERGNLSVLVHERTGDDLYDHIQAALWLGPQVELKYNGFRKQRSGTKSAGAPLTTEMADEIQEKCDPSEVPEVDKEFNRERFVKKARAEMNNEIPKDLLWVRP